MKLYDVYPLFDINIVKGKGCKVWDDKGQEYLDLYGGHAVISIGHCHPHYVEMLTNQLNNLGFYSNSVINKLQVKLAERLGKISGYEDYLPHQLWCRGKRECLETGFIHQRKNPRAFYREGFPRQNIPCRRGNK